MPRGRSPQHQQQRAAILAGAARLFARQGYAATSMIQVADAVGLSKASLYHYVRDKDALLAEIALDHVLSLRMLLSAPVEGAATGEQRLRALIERFVRRYADARDAHRVLTEDVKFLAAPERERVLAIEREIVAGLARIVVECRPDLSTAQLAKPLTMLLFGMINWMHTWLRPDGTWDHDRMAPVVADLFIGGLAAIRPERVSAPAPAADAPSREQSRTRTPENTG